MGAEEEWMAVFGEEVAEIVLEREGEVTTSQVTDELQESYDKDVTEYAVDRVLSLFNERDLLSDREPKPWSSNSRYVLNGSGPEDYDRVISDARHSF